MVPIGENQNFALPERAKVPSVLCHTHTILVRSLARSLVGSLVGSLSSCHVPRVHLVRWMVWLDGLVGSRRLAVSPLRMIRILHTTY
jgi:hypothetical protein